MRTLLPESYGAGATGQRQLGALARWMKANAATICKTLGIGRTMLDRYLAESGDD
jgi:hypothetical protein